MAKGRTLSIAMRYAALAILLAASSEFAFQAGWWWLAGVVTALAHACVFVSALACAAILAPGLSVTQRRRVLGLLFAAGVLAITCSVAIGIFGDVRQLLFLAFQTTASTVIVVVAVAGQTTRSRQEVAE